MEPFENRIKKQHRFQDYLYWNLTLAVPLITAMIAIAQRTAAGLVGFILLFVLTAGLLYRFFCPHCPHYIQGEKSTRCMFFWGIPKFFPEKPGPLSALEKTVSFAAPLVLLVFPLPWLLDNFGLLLIYCMSLAVAGLSIWRQECVRCAFRHCPANRVPAGPED